MRRQFRRTSRANAEVWLRTGRRSDYDEKIADLGAKGVTYRAVAGPLGTKQEAMDLCTKIKGVGGDKACFVTN